MKQQKLEGINEAASKVSNLRRSFRWTMIETHFHD
jgi:hypothetical protein